MYTYTVTEDYQLIPADPSLVTHDMWVKLAARFKEAGNLELFPLDFMKKPWKKGLCALIIHEGEIIHHYGNMTNFDPEIGKRIANTLSISADALPKVSIYTPYSGWTHKNWRKKGLATKVRQRFYKNMPLKSEEYIFLIGAFGRNAVHLNEFLKFERLPITEIPYLRSFRFWPIEEDKDGGVVKAYNVLKGEIVTHKSPYYPAYGDIYDDLSPDRNYIYFYASNARLARQVNAHFERLVGGDFSKWNDVLDRSLRIS